MASLRGLRARISALTAPAPMQAFVDYDEYWRRRGELAVVHERWRVAATWIPEGATVLDVGCGSGEFLAYLRSQRPSVIARGVDVSTRSVEMARALGVEAEVADVTRDPVSGDYDYVTCFETLEHLPDAESVITELKRLARHAIIVSIPNVGYIENRIRLSIFGRFPITNCVYHISEHVRHWTPRDFSDWVEHHGLTIAEKAGQYGVPVLWRRSPSVFAAGLVYLLRHATPDQ